jgi:hypothetical protein
MTKRQKDKKTKRQKDKKTKRHKYKKTKRHKYKKTKRQKDKKTKRQKDKKTKRQIIQKGGNDNKQLLHVTNDIISNNDELTTYGLVSCMAIFWRDNNEQNNYLIHASERQIELEHHPLYIVNAHILEKNPTILNNTIYVYSIIGFTPDEEKYIEDNFKDFNIQTKHYNVNYIIGLDKTGVLIDKDSEEYFEELKTNYIPKYIEDIFKVSLLKKDCSETLLNKIYKSNMPYYNAYKEACLACNYNIIETGDGFKCEGA